MPRTNSRNKGIQYEQQLAKKYRAIGYTECVTARSESKRTDDLGIDLCYTGDFQVQAKCYTDFSIPKAIETLKSMPQNNKKNIAHVKIATTSKPLCRRGSVVVIMESDRLELLESIG